MTVLFTCSYRAYRQDMGQAVACSLGLPRWHPEAEQWPRCWLIAPSAALFHGPAEGFADGYEERLERFGARKIARVLEQIARTHQAERLVLLCHEADWDRCHRQQFAAWWTTTTGELVTELLPT